MENCKAGMCCMAQGEESTYPLGLDNTIKAGCVAKDSELSGCTLAKIYFPNQEYRAGFIPPAALEEGTLFPELVRIYK